MNRVDDLTDYGSLSLAGVMLTAGLVHARARGLPMDQAATRAVKRAITTQHAATLRDVFPQPTDLRAGAEGAINALEGRPAHPEVLRYTLQLIELAGLLKKSPAAVGRLGKELDALPAEPTDTELARVYQVSISTLGKRIQVTGKPALLQQEHTADEIRALLLAGVRFAWLWQQLGGRRWHLVLQRKSILRAMKALNTVLASTIH